jgi:hypothetical protein
MQDRVTKTLQNLVTEIDRIQNTRSGKAMPRARRDESKILQVLTAEYLREKGAPKVSAMYANLTYYSDKLMTDLGMYE